MKLGLITDIHEHVELLRIALDRFDQEQVDQIVEESREPPARRLCQFLARR